MNPRVYIFDLFGVVISFDDQIVYRRIAKHCKNPDDAVRDMNDLVSTPELITNALTLNKLHRQLCNAYGLTLTVEAFEALWREPYSQSMAGMNEILTGLRAQHRLILLSNIDRYYWQTVKELHVETRHFDDILLSCELGMAKPNPLVFARAAEVAGASPAECFFVDDKLANVEAARALGFNAHFFQGVPGLRAALQAAAVSGF